MEDKIVGGIYKFKKGRNKVSKNASCEEKAKSHWHAFAVLSINESYSRGFMLTHANSIDFPEHQLMKSEHFIKGWSFKFEETYFLRIPLIKINDLATTQVGMLSEDGLEYIAAHAIGEDKTWGDYIRDYCK